ncbi:mitochondrial import inner membrane translocase subunit Tim23 [Contarinia nasturtii]|uniref:mitochondrial import inner membrane translocase subunit Tim23 n=1 Tax=Contarinia nasturtii TaxID=265458 RepID=UPI0012D4056E|nr:mitochondrial import inner membrane translocase subunit Tim23 [Contarinia nasturtii]
MKEDYLSQPLNIKSGEKSSTDQYVRQQSSVASFSPYLNYDPRVFSQQTQPEFIFPEGAGKQQRGRFELAFSQIGSAVMIGAGLGGMVGLYNGIAATSMANQSGKLRRTQLLNHIMKQGSATGNSLGSITVIYSVFGVLLQFVRGKDDETNTVLAGTSTGLLYKSTAGLRRCAVGGAMGLTISGLFCAYSIMTSNGKNKQFL